MQHLRIPKGVTEHFKNKIVDKVSYCEDNKNYDENHLVITFTDGTYISIQISVGDSDYCLTDEPPLPLEIYGNTPEGSVGCVVGGTFKYYKYFKQLIDIGVIDPLPEEVIDNQIKDNIKQKELREYEEYKRLKSKYEHYEP